MHMPAPNPRTPVAQPEYFNFAEDVVGKWAAEGPIVRLQSYLSKPKAKSVNGVSRKFISVRAG